MRVRWPWKTQDPLAKQSRLKVAIDIATSVHQGQFDKTGEPYIFHPLRVSSYGRTQEERIVGALHDVIEDGHLVEGATVLRAIHYLQQFFDDPIMDAVMAVTRCKNETYKQFIHRVSLNPLALAVKLNDLADNTDPRRGPIPGNLSDRYAWAKSELLARQKGKE
jgi:(p)ppGpp synthase/HD superfamily hydrolase